MLFWGLTYFSKFTGLEQILVSTVAIPLMSFLYTGMFITAHDAMHGLVSPNKKINSFFGYLCPMLYAGLWYPSLKKNHLLHHSHPTTGLDPDYSPKNFVGWYVDFLGHYLGVWTLVFNAVVFELAVRFGNISTLSLIIFWIIPAILSTGQLFYFGTYLPHRRQSGLKAPHFARTIFKKNSPRIYWKSFLSCYHFGLHWEHHQYPHIPWWYLPKVHRRL